jgi:hypothetical protein
VLSEEAENTERDHRGGEEPEDSSKCSCDFVASVPRH